MPTTFFDLKYIIGEFIQLVEDMAKIGLDKTY